MSTPTKNTTSDDRGFLFGILWSVWWLHRAHGEDTYATDLLIESVGRDGVPEIRRMAQQNQYRFKRGFWADVTHRLETR